jgi:hypothetical protein
MKKLQSKIGFCIVMACLALGLSTLSARAFSLLGPFQPWMEYTNGLRQPGDIGGPMDITNEYRWNVPVVTYGFDQSFLNFFGSNGVAAVESAIQILNDLPSASQIALTNYPFDSRQMNASAQSQWLIDLKSETLSLLLEQMGLAQPTRCTFVLKQWTPFFTQNAFDFGLHTNDTFFEFGWGYWAIPDFIDELNFDPIALSASPYVNKTLYTAGIYGWDSPNPVLFVSQTDPFVSPFTAVADFPQSFGNDISYRTGSGIFYTGLTYDDVGGLAYLLSTNNVNYEILLPGIHGVGTNADSFMNGAWRPGVGKITFVPQPMDSATGAFLPATNQFTDTYITNGNVVQQQLVRVVSQPDFLFCAADVDSNSTIPWISFFSRTGTTNWINNAALNRNPGGAGPGLIQPQVKIALNKTWRVFGSDGNFSDEVVYDGTWYDGPFGSFNGSSNQPVIYPVREWETNQFTVRMWLAIGTNPGRSTTKFDWSPNVASGAVFLFQTSTNLADWLTLFTNWNNGGVTTYFLSNPKAPTRFYRLVPQ